MKYFLLVLSCLSVVFFGCRNTNEEISSKSENTSQSASIQKMEDSVLIPKFTINLKLSEKAEDSLNVTNESIIVCAYLTGEPKDSLLENGVFEDGFSLGNYSIELFKERRAIFDFIKIPTA